jgi:transcriptional regulator with XRE-family HTH domain
MTRFAAAVERVPLSGAPRGRDAAMTMPGSPTVRRRRLAAELRAIRESRGKSGDNVAAALKWSPSKISRYELARTGLKVLEVEKLLDYYEITGSRRAELLELARDAAQKGWWEAFADELSPDYQQFIGFEHEAVSIAIWHVEVIPGLLQTPAYARHIIGNYGLIEPIAPGMIERLVRVRMQRQQVLTRESPAQLSVVLDESSLRRRIGDEGVMYDQLTYLAELAGQPNIAIRILPLNAQHAVLGPAFVILHFGSFSDALPQDVVTSEQVKGVFIVEGEQETHLHRLVFQSLVSVSLDVAESKKLILETAESCWADGRASALTS